MVWSKTNDWTTRRSDLPEKHTSEFTWILHLLHNNLIEGETTGYYYFNFRTNYQRKTPFDVAENKTLVRELRPVFCVLSSNVAMHIM